MRQKLLSILALLCLIVSGAWADGITVNFPIGDGAYISWGGSMTRNGIKIQANSNRTMFYNDSPALFEVYGVNVTYTISMEDGSDITGVNITLSGNNDMFQNDGWTANGNTRTWTGNAKSVTFGINCKWIPEDEDGYWGSLSISAISVTVPAPASYDVTANSASEAYWATFYSNAGNYQAPEGTQVFTVSLAGTGITMNEISDRIAKSGEGVVLKKTTTGNFTMTLTETVPAGDFSGNSLTGTMTSITNPGNAYVLNGTNGAGFYKLSASGTIGANKAYLVGPAAAREFFLFDETTGIEMPTAEDNVADAVVYDLQGHRVLNPTKGLYIVNDKKVFINK